MLQNYAEKPIENWRSKDAAIYLITSSATKAQTQKHGVTQSSHLVPLPQFTVQHIETELTKPNRMYCQAIMVFVNDDKFIIYIRIIMF